MHCFLRSNAITHCSIEKHNFYRHWETKNFIWLAFLWYSLYCSSLETKPKYLQDMPIICLLAWIGLVSCFSGLFICFVLKKDLKRGDNRRARQGNSCKGREAGGVTIHVFSETGKGTAAWKSMRMETCSTGWGDAWGGATRENTRLHALGASAETPDRAWGGGRWEAPFKMVLADHEPGFLRSGPQCWKLVPESCWMTQFPRFP